MKTTIDINDQERKQYKINFNQMVSDHQKNIKSFNQVDFKQIGGQSSETNSDNKNIEDKSQLVLATYIIPIENLSIYKDDLGARFKADIEFLHEEVCNFLLSKSYNIHKVQITPDFDYSGNIMEREYSLHYYLENINTTDKLIELEDQLEIDLYFENPSTMFYKFIDDNLTVFLHG